MVQVKTKTRVTATLLAVVLAFASGSAGAGTGGGGGGGDSVAGRTILACGEFVVKLRDFGKLTVNDYNRYVPPNFQTTPGRMTPTFTFVFSPAPADTFVMAFSYPGQLGNTMGAFVTGTYRQRGKKLNFEVNDNGAAALETTFRNMGDNMLFGARALVTDIPYALLNNRNKMRFKGRIKNGGDNLKVKFKARMLYDIQFETASEYPDVFNAGGTFKLRAQTKKCPAP